MSLTDPRFTDGLGAVLGPLIENLNIAGDGTTYQRYEYLSDSITVDGSSEEQDDGDKHPLGSDARTGFEKGAISLKCVKATHKLPKPGHILHCDFGDGDEYYVVNSQGRSRSNRQMKAGNPAVTRAYNPIVSSLLSEAYGQRKSLTQAAGALSGSLAAAPTAVNTRSGATLAWSLAAMPGYTAPSWLSINSSTGALSGTAVAGTWELKIICTDTLTGEENRAGFGILSMVIT